MKTLLLACHCCGDGDWCEPLARYGEAVWPFVGINPDNPD
jgi:hypothetical protein